MIQIALLGFTPIVGRRRTKKICLLCSYLKEAAEQESKIEDERKRHYKSD